MNLSVMSSPIFVQHTRISKQMSAATNDCTGMKLCMSLQSTLMQSTLMRLYEDTNEAKLICTMVYCSYQKKCYIRGDKEGGPSCNCTRPMRWQFRTKV